VPRDIAFLGFGRRDLFERLREAGQVFRRNADASCPRTRIAIHWPSSAIVTADFAAWRR
jgi:hypothetical protein